MGKVVAVCIGRQRGMPKKNVHQATFAKEFGISGDVHAGQGDRQVSLLSFEDVEEYRLEEPAFLFGSFGENLVVSGMSFRDLPPGTKFVSGDILLELIHNGNLCGHNCGNRPPHGCAMHRAGAFCRVIHGGIMTEEDEFKID